MSALDMSPIAFKPDPCCDNPRIGNKDHISGYTGKGRRMVNRYCSNCWTQWYGPEGGEVKRYSDEQWLAMMHQHRQAVIAGAIEEVFAA